MKRILLFKRWFSMLTGSSSFNVNQGVGKNYSKKEIKGYYNDLTDKVKKTKNIDVSGLPYNHSHSGDKIYFPIVISQYGLAVYDLYLETGEKEFYKKFERCSEWLLENQNISGGWDNLLGMGVKYSSMSQGEGISLLSRYYLEKPNKDIYIKIEKAFKFLKESIEKNGTTRYENEEVFLEEYPKQIKSVLNGWVFSIFGVYDYCKLTRNEEAQVFLKKTLDTLEKNIYKYDCKFWSTYDINQKIIASPFYHDLHISLLKAVYEIWGLENTKILCEKFEKYNKIKFFKLLAIFMKVYQKIKKPGKVLLVD